MSVNTGAIEVRLQKVLAHEFRADMRISGLSVEQSADGTVEIKLRLNAMPVDPRLKEMRALQAKMLGLPDDAVGRQVVDRNKRFKIVGFNVNAPKNAVQLECLVTGKEYRCSVSYVEARLEPSRENPQI